MWCALNITSVCLLLLLLCIQLSSNYCSCDSVNAAIWITWEPEWLKFWIDEFRVWCCGENRTFTFLHCFYLVLGSTQTPIQRYRVSLNRMKVSGVRILPNIPVLALKLRLWINVYYIPTLAQISSVHFVLKLPRHVSVLVHGLQGFYNVWQLKLSGI
jgi:hypothetical protein